MKMEEAKLVIIKHILDSTDESLIQHLYGLFEDTDPWDEYSDELKAEIEESIAQHESGEVIPHEVVMKEYEKWLKK